MKSQAYMLQNKAIHEARGQLEKLGLMIPGDSLNAVRSIAGELNLGIQSISRLTLQQRRTLIDRLNTMGARVRNPQIYKSDRQAEGGSLKKGSKVVVFSEATEEQLRMLDTMAAKITWKEADGYLRFCAKQIKTTRPMNNRQVTRIRCALQSIIKQQAEKKFFPFENQQTSV